MSKAEVHRLEYVLSIIANFDMEAAAAKRILDMKTNKKLGCYWFSDALKEVQQIAKDALNKETKEAVNGTH